MLSGHGHKHLRDMEQRVEPLLQSTIDDTDLRIRLEEIAKEDRRFDALMPLWGPALYRRNRVLFRPFIISHFSTYYVHNKKWYTVGWKEARDLAEPWLEQTRRDGDLQLFQKLYQWRLHDTHVWKNAGAATVADLVREWQHAASPGQRAQVLQLYDMWFNLDEDSALRLYRDEPDLTRRFILKHAGNEYGLTGEKRVPWAKVMAEAQRRDDWDLYYKLYRKRVPLAQWEVDVAKCCHQYRDPNELNDELRKRHPEGYGLNLGGGFYAILERRGRDALPYLLRHLENIRSYAWQRINNVSWYGKIRDLAWENKWFDLWAGIVRVAAPNDEYNKSVLGLIEDRKRPDAEVLYLLSLLAGIRRELNFGRWGFAGVQPLSDDTAVALYGRFPELLRGPFRTQMTNTWYARYPKLMDAGLAANDEAVVDFLASRLAAQNLSYSWQKQQAPQVDKMSKYYEALLATPEEFARRAIQVLALVPAYAVWRYDDLVKENRLARLLFERSAVPLLSQPASVRDLLESPSIMVQHLVFRVLSRDDDRARAAAAANLDILQAVLFRPLHRKTRLDTFLALENAARAGAEHAEVVLSRAREAADLPDKRYPKEELFGLMGRTLVRYPQFRSPAEQPVVYRKVMAA